MKLLLLTFLLLILKNIFLALDLYEKKDITDFPPTEKINCLITNYFTHETFLKNTADGDPIESSIFFIIGEKTIKSYYINNYFTIISSPIITRPLYNLFSVSSDYIYIPKYYLFSTYEGEPYEK